MAIASPPIALISSTTSCATGCVDSPLPSNADMPRSFTTTLAPSRREQQRLLPADAPAGSRHDHHSSITDAHSHTLSQMPHPLRGKSAIAGVADAASPTGDLDERGRVLEVSMIREALEDAGLTIDDVDGVCSADPGMGSLGLAEHLGVHPTWVDSTMTGGSCSSTTSSTRRPPSPLGQASVVVVRVRVDAAQRPQRPRRGRAAGRGGRGGAGAAGPSTRRRVGGALRAAHADRRSYALAASRHMAEFGTTSEQLAQIAVDAREWAAKNPRARFQDPIGDRRRARVGDGVLAAAQARLLPATDGAGAFVMRSAERAKDLAKPPVYVLGAGTSTTHSIISQMPDLTARRAAVLGAEGDRTWPASRHDDVDLLQLYDSFTITSLLLLEDLGFCKKGEGGAFVEDGKLGPGGALPTNTNGGGLCYTHPGMYGMFLIVEAVRQLRGECGDRQVPDCDVAIASRLRRRAQRDVDRRAGIGACAVSRRRHRRGSSRRPTPSRDVLGRHPRPPASSSPRAARAARRSGTRDPPAPAASAPTSTGDRRPAAASSPR